MKIEKRLAKRRELLKSFSFFASLKALGPLKVQAVDISETGIGIIIPTLDGQITLAKDSVHQMLFHLNPSFAIPLTIQIVRTEMVSPQEQHIGALFLDTHKPEHRALVSFIRVVDDLQAVALEIGNRNVP